MIGSTVKHRVLHVISSSGLYGAEAVILNLCRSLPARGIASSIALFANVHSPDHQLADAARRNGVQVLPVDCAGRFDMGAVKQLRTIIAKTECDIVHAHGYKADLYCYAAARKQKIALVATCHTWYDNDVAVRLYGMLDRRILRAFHAVVGVSESVMKRLRDAHVQQRNLTLIDNGIDFTRFENVRPTLNDEFPGRRLVGTVARLAPEKGIKYLIEAAAILSHSHPDVMFVVAGEGPDRASLEEQIDKHSVRHSFHLLGHRTDAPGIFASLQLLVQPSLDEGLPITLLEAMAAGCAIVATPVGAVPTAIKSEATGLLVPPADAAALAKAIERLLIDETLRQSLGRNARAKAQQEFSSDRMAADYMKVYEAALASVV